MGVSARVHADLAGRMHTNHPRLVEPGAGTESAHDLGGRDGARLDVGGESHTEQTSLLAGFRLFCPELPIVEHLEQLVEGGRVVAAVVRHGHQGLEGPRELRYE